MLLLTHLESIVDHIDIPFVVLSLLFWNPKTKVQHNKNQEEHDACMTHTLNWCENVRLTSFDRMSRQRQCVHQKVLNFTTAAAVKTLGP